MVKPLLFAPPLVFAALAGLFVWGMSRQDPSQLPTAYAGKPAPDVALSALGGLAAFSDADLRDGRIKLVNFWASWCAPCRVEHPNLEALAGQGVSILGVNYKDNPDKALQFIDNLGNPFALVGQDPEGRMALDWGVYGVPETFVVDGEGRVLLRYAGPLTDDVIRQKIAPLLAGQ